MMFFKLSFAIILITVATGANYPYKWKRPTLIELRCAVRPKLRVCSFNSTLVRNTRSLAKLIPFKGLLEKGFVNFDFTNILSGNVINSHNTKANVNIAMADKLEQDTRISNLKMIIDADAKLPTPNKYSLDEINKMNKLRDEDGLFLNINKKIYTNLFRNATLTKETKWSIIAMDCDLQFADDQQKKEYCFSEARSMYGNFLDIVFSSMRSTTSKKSILASTTKSTTIKTSQNKEQAIQPFIFDNSFNLLSSSQLDQMPTINNLNVHINDIKDKQMQMSNGVKGILARILINLANLNSPTYEKGLDVSMLQNVFEDTSCSNLVRYLDAIVSFFRHNIGFFEHDKDILSLLAEIESYKSNRAINYKFIVSNNKPLDKLKFDIASILEFDMETFALLSELTFHPYDFPIMYRYLNVSSVNYILYHYYMSIFDCTKTYLTQYINEMDAIHIVNTGDMVRYIEKLPEYARFIIYLTLMILLFVALWLFRKNTHVTTLINSMLLRITRVRSQSQSVPSAPINRTLEMQPMLNNTTDSINDNQNANVKSLIYPQLNKRIIV